MKQTVKIIGVVFVIFLLLLIAFNYPQKVTSEKEITYKEFINLLDENQISQVLINEKDIKIIPKDNSGYKGKVLFTANINDEKLISKLQDLEVSYSSVETKENPNLIIIVIFIVLIVFIYIVWRNRFLKHKSK
jgi:cell division protease FtsH